MGVSQFFSLPSFNAGQLTSTLTAGYSNTTTPYPPASGGADGSMLLSPYEAARQPSAPLEGYRQFLLQKYEQYNSSGITVSTSLARS